MERLDVIILAGGLGTRLRGMLDNLPKVLAPIGNKPFLDILLNFLNKWKFIKRVVIAVGYMSDKIINEYKNSQKYNFEIIFSEEKELLGTGGATKKALQHTETINILALNGDSYVDVDIEDLVKSHIKNNANMTIALKKVENADRYGSVKLNSENRIISFEEKKLEQIGGHINAGMYIFKRELFNEVEENKVISLEKELLPIFLKKRVYGYISYGKFIDIGIPKSYIMSRLYLGEDAK